MYRGGAYIVLGIIVASIIGSFMVSFSIVKAKTRVEVSIFHPGSAYNIGSLTSFEQSLGVDFTSAKWYQDWATAFDPGVANRYNSAGYIPELTWEPSSSGAGISYQEVIDGAYDTYINQTASSVKNLGYTIRVSLAPEMNATWTPWGGKAGNNPTNFKGFWQHVVQKFRDAGANNVKWIWSPNVIPYVTERVGTYSEMYPGSDYVDYMGLDGYNWGTSQSWATWQSFSQVFSSSYNEITKVSSKDILIMEMASTEAGGSKAAWITDMYNTLQNGFPRIKGFTWFNINKETDWRINSSAESQASFIAGYLGAAAPSSDNSSSSPVTSTGSTATTANKKKSTIAQNSPVAENPTVATPELQAPAAEVAEVPVPVPAKTTESLYANSLGGTEAAAAQLPLFLIIVCGLSILLSILIHAKRAFLGSSAYVTRTVHRRKHVDSLHYLNDRVSQVKEKLTALEQEFISGVKNTEHRVLDLVSHRDTR